MINRSRVNKIEKNIGSKEEKHYVISPYPIKGEKEVVVYCNKVRSTISREEFDLLNVDEKYVTKITINFV